MAAIILTLPLPAQAGDITSAYTKIDPSDCMVFTTADAANGVPRQAVCPGYGGYPVLILTTADRESVYYGFPPHGEFISRWVSFSAPNRMGGTIEWRVLTEGDRSVPVAAIQRWFIDDPNHSEAAVEVLVVRKVGQIEEWRGCILGYVVATGNADANQKAREIADAKAHENDCRIIDVAIEEGARPLPSITLYGYD
ncbi:hypothetical protein [Manganibacter manganicus]|uniref:hypothetical protein n=1 Tax=Manganibacter manganicus TaxID=1873176 RepID=UPI00111B61B1|nr:hypothetical protein [Pseudaminobacter manganicus]